MSRTRKGSKGPGWEPWSNRHEKAEQKADYREPEDDGEPETCSGCRLCLCVMCGDYIVVDPHSETERLYCIGCGHEEALGPDEGEGKEP